MTGRRGTASAGRSRRSTKAPGFAAARAAGLALPGVRERTRYDGSPVLTLGGCLVAGVAGHPSAEPDSLWVRITDDDRERFLAEAPDAYYLTDYYARHPVVLARLSRLDEAALRDLLTMSWRLTAAKTRIGSFAVGRRAERSR